jgi:DNA-binding transcriptional LysR family regulator
MNAILDDMNLAHLNITMLRVLVSLAETGSFSRTAERLCITQSAVSHAVRGLETAVGAQLMIRERKGLTLTAAGETALASALSALDALETLLGAGRRSLAGKVRLASVVSASTTIVPEALAVARRRHPNLNISLLVGTDAEVTGWVADGIADVGLAYDTGRNAGEALVEDQLYAVAGPASASGLSPATPSAFAGRDFVMSGAGCGPMLKALFARWNVKPNIVATVSDMNALFAITGAGLGISIVPGLAFPTNWRELVLRYPLHPAEHRPLKMMTGRGTADQPLAGTLEILRNVCSRAGPVAS